MSYLDLCWPLPVAELSDEDVFLAWLNFGGGWTLEEFTAAFREARTP